MPLSTLLRILATIPFFASVAVGLTGTVLAGPGATSLVMMAAGGLGVYLLVQPARLRLPVALGAVSFGGVLTIGRAIRPFIEMLLYGGAGPGASLGDAFRLVAGILLLFVPWHLVRRLRQHEQSN